MKHNSLLSPNHLVAGAAFALALSLSAQAAVGSARVSAVRAGAAQYSEDGVTWNSLTAGVTLKPGATIKTDSLGIVNLNLGRNGPFVRVTPDTTLSLTTLNIDDGAGERIITTELGLKAGTIVGQVRKLSAASKYEVVTPVSTVGIRGGKYQVSARGEFTVAEGEGYVHYKAPGETAPTTFQVRSGYTFEPTLNNNKGGLIEALPSVLEQVTLATGEVAAPAPGEPVVAYQPTPTWDTIDRPFVPPGQGNPFAPFVIPPTANPTSEVGPRETGTGDGNGE